MERLYSVVEAAKALGDVSVWSVRAWLSQGKLERTKVGGRTMVSERALEEFVRNSTKMDRGIRKYAGQKPAEFEKLGLR